MSSEEKPRTAPKFKETDLYTQIRDDLLKLDKLYTQSLKSRESTSGHEKKLDQLGSQINILEIGNKNDPYFKQLKLMYEDLKGDKEAGRDWNLDSCMLEIGRMIRAEIDSAGIKMLSNPDDMSGKVAVDVKKLKALGLPVEYAVESRDPYNSPTVVLFLYVHADIKGTKGDIANRSDQTTETYMRNLLTSNVSNVVYHDGYLESIKHVYADNPDAPYRISRESGSRLQIIQCENQDLTMLSAFEGRNKERRVLFGNAQIAYNINTSAREHNDDFSMVTMGLGHERNYSGFSHDSFYELSRALAYEGCNVIVVNTIPKELEDRFKK